MINNLRRAPPFILVVFLSFFTTKAHAQMTNSKQILIDKVIVPSEAVREFNTLLTFNRDFIKKLPGFIEDQVYERSDEDGNLVIITVAVWESGDAIKKAKEAVQAEYQKQGFNLQEVLKRLQITIDRGIYKIH
jgi:heme-degrading monooxygenase HmoA